MTGVDVDGFVVSVSTVECAAGGTSLIGGSHDDAKIEVHLMQ